MKTLALALAGLAFSLSASAEIVTFEYTGVINQVREGAYSQTLSRAVVSSSIVPGSLGVGDAFHGRFSIDTAAPLKTHIEAPGWALYQGAPDASASTSFIVSKSGTSKIIDGIPEVSVQNGGFSPIPWQEGFQDQLQISPAWNSSSWFGLNFYDPTGAVFSSADIPAALALGDFYDAILNGYWVNEAGTHYASFNGMLTSITKVSPVPEPSTYALLFAGLAVVGGAASARKRNRILPLKD